MSTQKTLEKNAEVTHIGVKTKGSKGKGGAVVLYSPTPLGIFKRRILYTGMTVLTAVNAYGIYSELEGAYLINASWALGTVLSIMLLTLFFTKTE